jgi:hypothetical protein
LSGKNEVSHCKGCQKCKSKTWLTTKRREKHYLNSAKKETGVRWPRKIKLKRILRGMGMGILAG